jgi:hypothetical protein
MNTTEEIEARRNAILDEIRSIRSMKQGSVTEQYLKVKHKGKSEPVLRGPYFVFTKKRDKKTVGYRLKEENEIEQAKHDVSNHKRFMELCREYGRLTERLGELECAAKTDSHEKKLHRSRSRKTQK